MTSRVLYSNSNEISSLIESVCGWKVTPLHGLDEGPGELMLFDLLFYGRPQQEWTMAQLLENRPEWESEIVPLFKARQYAHLFTHEWYLMSYIKELDTILFQPLSCPPETLEDRHCLLATDFMTFMMKQEIKRLVAPVTYARDTSERLSAKLKRPVDLGVPRTFRDVCDRLEELVLDVDREVSDWKDRFFFDALEGDDGTLCYECKENMRVTFYVQDDRSQALKWKPHGEWCSRKDCKYYKRYLFNEWYHDTDVRDVPVEYEGYSD